MFISKTAIVVAVTIGSLSFNVEAAATSVPKYYNSPKGIQGAIKVVEYKTVYKKQAVRIDDENANGGATPATFDYQVIPVKVVTKVLWRKPEVLARGSKPLIEGDKAVISNGLAYAPEKAPNAVKKAIWAGNEIAKKPYLWGGGHGSWIASGYDCSGSVSYALRGGGLVSSPLTSGGFMSWGKRGSGKWITVYANSGHVWMRIAGVSFDTSGASPSRWQLSGKTQSGYSIRQPSIT